MEDAKIIAIVGPTASGKTSLAIEIAKKYNGEVISVDSRQVYKDLDIGTEKVTKEEMGGIPHHMIDIVEPEETLSVQEFQEMAREKIKDIISRNKLPILAGGSGQYMDAILYDVTFPQVPPNKKLREDLEKIPTSALMKVLHDQDPKRAETIDPNNKQRIIRALEIIEALGTVPEQKDSKLLYNTLYLGIQISREDIREKITKRLNETLEKGLVEEVKKIRERVGDEKINSFGLEYRVVRDFLDKKINETELKEKLIVELMQYAKRQMTWFKRNKDIIWEERKNLEKEVEIFLRS
ncbi:MAG: tRNA (adenosine(37)-N6)-dimethylallyltransferase MiaA [Patescibacteria group bacterium UBA2103]